MTAALLCLRAMQPDDLPAIMAIENRVFIGDAWPESFYRRDLANPNSLYCILELVPLGNEQRAEGAVVGEAAGVPCQVVTSAVALAAPLLLGYAGCWFIEDEAHLMTIAVAPEWQGRGLGEWLLLHMLDLVEARGASACTLEVRVSNSPAQALYRKLGFTVAGRRRRYYQDNNEDALIMTTPPLGTPAMQDLRRRCRRLTRERLARL